MAIASRFRRLRRCSVRHVRKIAIIVSRQRSCLQAEVGSEVERDLFILSMSSFTVGSVVPSDSLCGEIEKRCLMIVRHVVCFMADQEIKY